MPNGPIVTNLVSAWRRYHLALWGVWLRRKPLERLRQQNRTFAIISPSAGWLSKYRNDNLWPIYSIINGLNLVELSRSYSRLGR